MCPFQNGSSTSGILNKSTDVRRVYTFTDLEQFPAIIHGSHSKILTPLSHCLKLTILEKRLIYNFFLVFHKVYIFAFYCKFKIVYTKVTVILDSILIRKAQLIISSCMLTCAI